MLNRISTRIAHLLDIALPVALSVSFLSVLFVMLGEGAGLMA